MSTVVGRFDTLDISATPSPPTLRSRGYMRSFSTPTLPLSTSPQDVEEAPIKQRSPTYPQPQAGSSHSKSSSAREGRRPVPPPLPLSPPSGSLPEASRFRSVSTPVPISIQVTDADEQLQGRVKSYTVSGALHSVAEDEDEDGATAQHSPEGSNDS